MVTVLSSGVPALHPSGQGPESQLDALTVVIHVSAVAVKVKVADVSHC